MKIVLNCRNITRNIIARMLVAFGLAMFIIPQTNAQNLDCSEDHVFCTPDDVMFVEDMNIQSNFTLTTATIDQGDFYDTTLVPLRGGSTLDISSAAIEIAPANGQVRLSRADGGIVEYVPDEFFNGTVDFRLTVPLDGSPADMMGTPGDLQRYPFQITVECPTMGCRTPAQPAMADDDDDRRDEFIIASSGMLAATWLFNRYVASTALQDKLTTYALPLSDEHYEYGLQFQPNDHLDIGLSVTDKSYVEDADARDDSYALKVVYKF